MPRGKKMQTPSKEPESSSMTHEEEKEMLHDTSKLQEQVQQMSRSQKLTEAKINGMESKIKGVEAKIDDWKTDLKTYVESLKIDLNTNLKTSMTVMKTDLTDFLQEILTNGEKVVKESHDANKINVNHDIIDSNVGLKTTIFQNLI